MARWIRGDSTIRLHSDYIDEQMLFKVYRLMCTEFPVMPIQIWKEFTYNSPSALTGGYSQEKYIRVRAWSFEQFPFEYIKIFNDNDELIFEEYYMPTDIKTEVELKVESNEYNPVYVEVKYFGLVGTIKRGFPQLPDTEDEKYLPNSYLDMKALEFGLRRRIYKENIDDWDSDKCFPFGYTYPIEQDYCLEKRLLNEYPVVSNIRHGVVCINGNYLDFCIRDDCYDVIDIHVVSYMTDENLYSVRIFNQLELLESFDDWDVFELINFVNNDSKYVQCHLIPDSEVEGEVVNLKQSGIFDRFGLLRSELFQHLGVVPEVKNITDYCLKWDEGAWNGAKWAGDDWVGGVFFVFIPLKDIPFNFNLLKYDELMDICNKTTPVGTKDFPYYKRDMNYKTNWR